MRRIRVHLELAGRRFIAPMSLRARLLLGFAVFCVACLVTGSWQIVRYAAVQEQLNLEEYRNTQSILDLQNVRDLLSLLQRGARAGLLEWSDFSSVDVHLQELASDSAALIVAGLKPEELRAQLSIIENALTNGSRLEQDRALRVGFQQLDRVTELLLRQKRAAVQELAEVQSRVREKAVVRGLATLLFFLIAAMFLVYRTVYLLLRPLASMERFLDGVNPDLALPTETPKLGSNFRELSSFELSFRRFFKKILGHHDQNLMKLLAEKERADLVASSISDGILLLDGDVIVYGNPIAEKILGYSTGSLMSGQSLSDLARKPSTNDAETASASSARAILTSISRSMPVELAFNGTGRVQHYLIQARPVLTPTARADRTERIHATTLVVAQDVTLLRESQEAKSHFLATLSHEIKTPVTSLTMATRLLKRSAHQFQSDTLRNLVDTCVTDVDRMRGLLSDLLSISGFDTLTQKLAIQNVDLGKLIRHSYHSFRSEAVERNIELKCEVRLESRKPILVSVDPTKVSWALSNLVTNALRHTPKGGTVTVTVSENEGWAEVKVRDTGPGIDQRRIPQIFEKFSSFYDIRVARSGGAGVGLAITREIVVAHRGRIWVTSEPGQGSEFSFTLPLLPEVSDTKGVVSGQAACSGR